MKLNKFIDLYVDGNENKVKVIVMKKLSDGNFLTTIDNKVIEHEEPLECNLEWNAKYDSKYETTTFTKKDKIRDNGIVIHYDENCTKEEFSKLLVNKDETILALSENIDIPIKTKFKNLLAFKNSCNRFIDGNEKYFSFLANNIQMFVGEDDKEIILTKSMKSKIALNEYLTEPIEAKNNRTIKLDNDNVLDVEDYIKERFLYMSTNGISDLAMAVNAPAFYRIDKKLIPVDDTLLSVDSMFNIESFFLDQLKTDAQLKDYYETGFTRVAYPYYGVGRFRITMGRQRKTPYLSARALPETIRPLKDYHLSSIVIDLLHNNKGGLVLICGEPNSGKSSLASSVINNILLQGGKKVLTIEDPVETTFKHHNGLVYQLERGVDIKGFDDFSKMIVTQDPDVIYITEIRDIHELDVAVNQSKLGKVVFASTHGNSILESLSRLSIMAPKEERDSKTRALYGCLKLIIVQQLVPKANGKGVVPLHEILILNDSLRNTLVTNEDGNLAPMITTQLTNEMIGNKQLENDAYNLWQVGLITEEMFLDRIGKTKLGKEDKFKLYKDINVIDILEY